MGTQPVIVPALGVASAEPFCAIGAAGGAAAAGSAAISIAANNKPVPSQRAACMPDAGCFFEETICFILAQLLNLVVPRWVQVRKPSGLRRNVVN